MALHSLRGKTHHLNKRLQFRLRSYFLISIILIFFLIYNIFRGTLSMSYGIIGLLGGIGVGILTSRTSKLSWDKNAQKVVTRLDIYGLVLIAIYGIFELVRERIVAYFTHDTQVATVGFAVLAGMMLGRFLGIRGKIIEVLKEQKIFH